MVPLVLGSITLRSRPHLSVWVCVLVTSQVVVLLEKGSGLEVKFPTMLPLTRRETTRVSILKSLSSLSHQLLEGVGAAGRE